MDGGSLDEYFSDEEQCSKYKFEELWEQLNNHSVDSKNIYSTVLYDFVKKIYQKYLEFSESSMVNQLKFDNQYPGHILSVLESIKSVTPEFQISSDIEKFFNDYDQYVDPEA